MKNSTLGAVLFLVCLIVSMGAPLWFALPFLAVTYVIVGILVNRYNA